MNIKTMFNKQREAFFDKEPKKAEHQSDQVISEIDEKMWARCNGCKKPLYDKMLESNSKVCPHCGYHFRLNPVERIAMTFDDGDFVKFDFNLAFTNPLNFPEYQPKHESNAAKTGENDAVVCGTGHIGGIKVVSCIMNSFFMMGSMGYIVGESITRSIEFAIENKLPLIIFTASGGARMQEGIISLMQMAKVSASLKLLSDEGLLYITVITNPTTGGVTASFASLGDIIVAEKGALVGFAGRRVIEHTMKQKLPKDFQTAEFALEHGFIDAIFEREQLVYNLRNILNIHNTKRGLYNE